MSRLREAMSPEQRVAILRDRKFELDEVRYPRRPLVGPHVCVDGRPYAAFVDVSSAESAVEGWLELWPAVKGRRLTIAGR